METTTKNNKQDKQTTGKETTMKTTTNKTAKKFDRWLCPYCELEGGIFPTVELETTDGESYTCPVCGCTTSAPEEDGCWSIDD